MAFGDRDLFQADIRRERRKMLRNYSDTVEMLAQKIALAIARNLTSEIG